MLEKCKKSIKIHKVFILVLVMMLGISYTQEVEAAKSHEDFITQAQILKELGLFMGTPKGFELDRLANRIEAGVIIVRLMGMEDEALQLSRQYPFKDIPDWATGYVSYLYQQQITRGISTNYYGSSDFISPSQFMTFCLRTIGYDDSKGDFMWNRSLEKAVEIQLIDDIFYEYLVSNPYLYRDDMVCIMYNLLNQPMKDKDDALIDFLIQMKKVTLEKALDLNAYRQPMEFMFKGTVLEVIANKKGLVVEEKNGVKYIVEIPFGELEEPYTGSLLIQDDQGKVYKCYLSKALYLSENIGSLVIGSSIDVDGILVVDITKNYIGNMDNHLIIMLKN